MEPFHLHFPELARKEIRTAHILGENPAGLPVGEYGMMEAYCTDPNCDCRRVMLNVFHNTMGLVAVIGFGFDADDSMGAPMLDPLNPQSVYAEGVLDLVCNVVLQDRAYVARLERHYRMVKEKVAHQPQVVAPRPEPAPDRWWKRKRKKPRR
jgi:hypothetical protein